MSYSWANTEQTGLIYKNGDVTLSIPADPANRHYAEYLASGKTATAYVAPAAASELTDAETLEQATGLTVAEIKAVLGIY